MSDTPKVPSEIQETQGAEGAEADRGLGRGASRGQVALWGEKHHGSFGIMPLILEVGRRGAAPAAG